MNSIFSEDRYSFLNFLYHSSLFFKHIWNLLRFFHSQSIHQFLLYILYQSNLLYFLRSCFCHQFFPNYLEFYCCHQNLFYFGFYLCHQNFFQNHLYLKVYLLVFLYHHQLLHIYHYLF